MRGPVVMVPSISDGCRTVPAPSGAPLGAGPTMSTRHLVAEMAVDIGDSATRTRGSAAPRPPA